jgi:hypothetical protein
MPAYALSPPHYELTDIKRKHDTRLVTQDLLGDKPCRVAVDTGAYVTVARPDIVIESLERTPNPGFTLHTVSGKFLPILIEVLLPLKLVRRPLRLWDCDANITDELILGLNILRANDASVDIGRQKLRHAEEELWVCRPGAGPRPFSLVVAKKHLIPAQCKGTVMARMESPLGAENGLVEPNPQAHPPEGMYIARTLVQVRQEEPVRILYTTHRDQKLTRRSPLAHCEPLTMETPPWGGSHWPKT